LRDGDDVERFGSLLRESIKQLGISEARFAREQTINRGLLYYIFEGKKPMPEERLQALLRGKVFIPEVTGHSALLWV